MKDKSFIDLKSEDVGDQSKHRSRSKHSSQSDARVGRWSFYRCFASIGAVFRGSVSIFLVWAGGLNPILVERVRDVRLRGPCREKTEELSWSDTSTLSRGAEELRAGLFTLDFRNRPARAG